MSRAQCFQMLYRCGRTTAAGAALFLLATAALPVGGAWAQSPPATGTAPAADSAGPKPRSVKQNIKNLGKEVTDPSTPSRIKAHEQELEKKIERTRDKQRQDHGKAKPGDMVDVVKKLDDAEPAADGKVKVDSKTTTTTTKTTTTTTTKRADAGVGGAPAR